MLKGAIPVLAVYALEGEASLAALAGLGAFLGHLYPVFFQFRGGKGVATALGALLAVSWITGLLALATWLAVSLTFRISSLAALTTFTLTPLYLWVTTGNAVVVGIFAVVAALIFWRHRSNIRNLLSGTEPKIGKSKTG